MDNIRATLKWWLRRALDISFDTLHGVDTSAVIPRGVQGAASPHRDAGLAYAYDPSPWRTVSRCLHLAGLSTCHDFTFVDIGCGKGRVLLSAIALPFARIIGVDFSPYLCDIARKNVNFARLLRRRCPNVEIVCCDAVHWLLPLDGPLILFFYNPFPSSVMAKVLCNIGNSHKHHPRPIYLFFYRMSSSLANIEKTLSEVSDGLAVSITSTQIHHASVSIYRLPAQ